MLRFPFAAGVTIALLTLFTGPVIAEEATSESDARLAAGLARFPEADADRDGVLTATEARAFVGRRRQGRDQKPAASYDRLPPTHADVAYGPYADNRLDLWVAESSREEPTPLAIFIHGGGFKGGDKRAVKMEDVRRLLDAGVSVASINYRLLDSGPFPIPMHDGARAVQYLRHHAAEYGLDTERFACFGGSAGGCMSMWLAMHDDLADPQSDDPVLRESTRLVCAAPSGGQSTLDYQAFQEWFGATPLVEHPSLRPLFGIRELEELEEPAIRRLVAEASPITHASADDPPIYASYGRGDTAVTAQTPPGVWVHHPRLGIRLKERLDGLGVECHVQYPGGPVIGEYTSGVDFLIQKLVAN